VTDAEPIPATGSRGKDSDAEEQDNKLKGGASDLLKAALQTAVADVDPDCHR